MATLHIEHAISEYGTWKDAFDRFAALREQSGVQGHHIFQPIDDPKYVVVDLEFQSAAQAEAFLRMLQTKVWSTPENSPALVGAPRAVVLEAVDRR